MKCTHCDVEFEAKNNTRKYCSNKCVCDANNAKKRVHHKYKKNCEQCGSEYEAYSANKNTKFCSRLCSNQWKKVHYAGRKITPEWLAKQNEAKKRENIVKYGDYECEVCQKKFETNTSLRSHRSYCSNKTEKMNVECDVCGRKFVRQRTLTTHKVLKHDVENNKKLRAAVKVGVSTRVNKKISGAEIMFLEQLKTLYGEEVQHQFKIDGIGHDYDFYVPSKNLIIEFDGDYWHGNKDNVMLTNHMKRQFYIDVDHTKRAIENGYIVHRVWASESEQYPLKVRKLDV